MLFAALIASEVIIESSTNNDELLLLTLDAEKAFDKLNHEILFNKLYQIALFRKKTRELEYFFSGI
jgi:hypothetical protein